MKFFVSIVFLLFANVALAMPAVLECASDSGDQFVLKGLEKADSGEGFKSYTFVNMQDDTTAVLSVGLLGEDQANGFVGISGFMDQFSESMISRLCTNEPAGDAIKTLVMKLEGGGAGGTPLCLACLAK